jgi:hypothetical protein
MSRRPPGFPCKWKLARGTRTIGYEADLHRIRCAHIAHSERLAERFLARPAIEESQRPVARVEGKVRLALASGQEPYRAIVSVGHCPRIASTSIPTS